MLCASLARQDNVQKVILGVAGTAAAFFASFFSWWKKEEVYSKNIVKWQALCHHTFF
jgi:hypothetical protein